MLASQDAFHKPLHIVPFRINAVTRNLQRMQDAVSKTNINQDPRDEIVAENFCDFSFVLGFADFAGDEGVEVGDMVRHGFVDDRVVDFGDGLQEDAIGEAEALGGHRVFASQAAEALRGIARALEQVFPRVQRLRGGAFDERDEEVSFARKMPVNDGFCDACGFRELCSRRAGVAFFGEEFGGDVEQLLFAFVRGEAARGGILRGRGGGGGGVRLRVGQRWGALSVHGQS